MDASSMIHIHGWEVLEVSYFLVLWLSFCVVVFVCFDAIVELQTINETMFNDFFIGSWKWIIHVMKGLFDSRFKLWICCHL